MKLGLYDSDTGNSLLAEKVVDLGKDDDGDPLSLVYCTAKRGRIVQIRAGALRVHYFLDEPGMDDDGDRIARCLCMNKDDALRIIRERAN